MIKSAKPIRIAVAALAATAALVVAGCGNVDAADLEGKLADQLAPQAGVDPADVTVDCPDDQAKEEGAKFDCTLTAPNGDEVTVNVTLTDGGDSFEAVVPPQQF
jgi:hypothetical protein